MQNKHNMRGTVDILSFFPMNRKLLNLTLQSAECLFTIVCNVPLYIPTYARQCKLIIVVVQLFHFFVLVVIRRLLRNADQMKESLVLLFHGTLYYEVNNNHLLTVPLFFPLD